MLTAASLLNLRSQALQIHLYRYCSIQPEIVIPPRIEREPSDILRALSGTLSRDYTAPNYKYHDDPWLIPYKNNAKRDYALAKEAGKKSARYILNKHPDLFEHNRIYAEPAINAYLPRAAYNRDNVTVELLDNLVSSYQVTDSMEVYNILKEKKKVIPKELRQNLLELVAFYNEEEAEEEGYEARGMLKSDTPKWKQGGFVEKLYSEDGLATSEARIALLLGYSKFNNNKGVIQMWEECKANEDVLPLEAFNAFIRSIRNENVEKCMEKVRNVLEEMKNNKLNPNTNTLISTLVVLKNTASGADYAQSCKYSLDLVAEFRNAGVNMSLGVYKMLLDIFVNLKSKQKNTILVDIMKAVEGQDFWPAGDEEDFYFFPRAMQVALYLNNSSLSWSINELLHTGNNLALLSHHNNETMYYNYFMSNVLQNDDFETAIELYNKVTPHIWCPSSTFYKNLLNAVHSHRGMNHLGKIYEDLYLSDMAGSNKETNYELNYQVMQILQSNDPNTSEFTGLTDVWLDITKKVFNHLETNIDNRNFGLRFNTHAANICSLCIMLNSNLGSYEQAVKVFKFCQEYRAIMPGQLPEQAVKTLLQQSLELEESATCLEIVEYALDIDNNTAISLANMVTDRLTLQTQDIKYLNKLFANSPEWKPL